MDDAARLLEAARDAYRRRDWGAAREGFTAARAAGELAAADLDALGDAAWWLGEVEEASAVLEAAYRRYLEEAGRARPPCRPWGSGSTRSSAATGWSAPAGSAGPSGCSPTSPRESSTATSSTWSWRAPWTARTPVW
jgi:hypothetical protein